MARYFFHLHECGTVIVDKEGAELADLVAVRDRALRAARDVMAAEVLQGKLCLGCCIVVEDGGYNEVLRVPFRDAVDVTGLSASQASS
jgi:hypothetical protein